MSTSNDILLDTYNLDDQKQKLEDHGVLVELPDPKFLNDDCTIIINGHHNYVVTHDQDNNELVEHEEEMKTFLDEKASTDMEKCGLLNSSSHELKMKECDSAEESEGEEEHESFTHLLQNKNQESASPKCQKAKVHKIPNFRSSPSKKHSTHDTHSHIQHRPLGLVEDTTTNKIFLKWNRSITRLACAAFTLSILVGISCLVMISLYKVPSTQCCEVENQEWWQNTVMYEIFPASFQDTDGDGFGDLQGILQRLDYVQNLSVDVVRLNSIFSALDYPLEYEHVIDFGNVDPHLGRLEDFEELIKEMHDRGMYVVLDMNPCVTSDQHTWAAHWLLHRSGRYESFYVNVSDDEVEPPLELNPRYSQHEWTPPHRTFGSHLFLNWTNPLVQLEMQDVMEFWLSQGIDGFYMKHMENMCVQDYKDIAHIFKQWRHLLDKFSINGTKKILMTSQSTMERFESILDTVSCWTVMAAPDLVDVSLDVTENSSFGESFDKPRQFWRQFSFPTPMLCWHLGSVETMRLASRLGVLSPMGAFLLLASLPGSCSVYYGDELSMKDTLDPFSSKPFRGGQLGLMQWTSDAHSNFTSGSNPWIPLNFDYQTSNVEFNPESLSLIRGMIELKKSPLLKFHHQTDPHFHTPSFIHDIMSKLHVDYDWKKGPSYTWLPISSNMIAVEIVTDKTYILMWNNGHYLHSFSDSKSLTDLYFSYASRDIDVINSTNSSLMGRVRLLDVQLRPGEAFLGQFIT